MNTSVLFVEENNNKNMEKAFKNYKIKKSKTNKKETWYGDLGKEMSEYFGTNCYWLPRRYEQWRLREKFKAVQNLEDKKLRHNFAYFMGMLNDSGNST